jgi:large subunit ribosomal protein L25
MSNPSDLKAQARDRVGKGAARELRRNNMVPAVIYGDKKSPLTIALPFKEIAMRINSGGFMTSVVTIDVDGEKHRVLPKDYQLDVVRDFPLHVDFLRVSKKTIVTVDIPVHFLNDEECPGIKAGGVLNIVRHTVECHSPADLIPDSIDIDLAAFELGDSINISVAKLPEGVEPTITDRDFTIATIASPAGLKSEEDEDAADVDVEVEIIGEETAEEGDASE